MLKFQKLALALCLFGAFTACKKDKDPVIIIAPSTGSQMTINGGSNGANAENSIFIDFSTDKQDSVKRNSWNLGFYSGNEFRVKLNNTTNATAVAVNKTDINSVTIADIKVDTLGVEPGFPGMEAVIDNPFTGDLAGTLIAEVSATDANNKVYVFNPLGATHSVPMDESKLMKIRILRKAGGYTLQYAKLSETTFKTLDINKNSDYNFQYVSLTGGNLVSVEPVKKNWDIQWTYSMFYMVTGPTYMPYTFSDIVFINRLAGVTAAEVLTSTVSYDNYAEANIATTTFKSDNGVIGSNWRSTQPATGAKTDRFYVIKDAAGNYYKLKFLSMGVGTDGGTRGKPRIEYKLVK